MSECLRSKEPQIDNKRKTLIKLSAGRAGRARRVPSNPRPVKDHTTKASS